MELKRAVEEVQTGVLEMLSLRSGAEAEALVVRLLLMLSVLLRLMMVSVMLEVGSEVSSLLVVVVLVYLLRRVYRKYSRCVIDSWAVNLVSILLHLEGHQAAKAVHRPEL